MRDNMIKKDGNGKPDLAILIGHALAKKGKAKHDPMEGQDMEEGEENSDSEYKDEADAHEHLKEISADLIMAIKEQDENAVADLLKEAFECLEMEPHKENEEGHDEDY